MTSNFGGKAMKIVIFRTENAAFKFDKKEVIEHLTSPESGYDSDEVSQLLKLISTDSDETILSWGKGFTCPDGHGLIRLITWRT